MSGALMVFENRPVTILNADGTPWDGVGEAWFLPAEVAELCGASQPKSYASHLLARNPEKFRGFQGVVKLTTPGGTQQVTAINENGLYMFLMASDLPKAVAFQRQVAELLKHIRQAQGQIMPRYQLRQMEAQARLYNAQARKARLLVQIAEQHKDVLSPKAVQSLLAESTAALVGRYILPKPQTDVHYSASDLAAMVGSNHITVGKFATKHGLKTAEYGVTILDVAQNGRQVPNFMYNERGKEAFLTAWYAEHGGRSEAGDQAN